MKRILVRFSIALVSCTLCASCSVEKKAEKKRPPNVGDQYVRGVLGAGQRAQATVGLMAIEKGIMAYQTQYGKNPSSLQELSRQGMLNPIPTAPPGKRFDYNTSSGEVKLVDK